MLRDLWSDLRFRFRAIFRRGEVERDLAEELQLHLDVETDRLVCEGFSTDEARRQARLTFGGVENLKEATRDARGTASVDELMQSVRLATRRLTRTPAFTAAAVLTLSVAIGATASVFGVVNAVLLKSLPLRDADRILLVVQNNPSRRLLNFSMSEAGFLDYRDRTRSFAALGGVRREIVTVSNADGPERVSLSAVTTDYFSALGLAPIAGRPLSRDSAGPAEVVIGYRFWQRHFGGAATALGKTLVLDDSAYTIVGIMPNGLPGDVELWTRLSFQASDLIHRDWHYVGVWARLKDGVTREAAQNDLDEVSGRLAREYPQTDGGWSIATLPLLEQIVGPVRPALLTLLAAAGGVLLIGISNLANLFLVRCLARERELAVRTALGATRGRLLRELLVEASIVGIVASIIGIALADAGVRILRAVGPASLPRLREADVDGHVLVFGVVTTIVTVLVFGALPAWLSSRQDPADAMKQGGRGTESRQHNRLQSGLAVMQVAVALVLMTGTGLLVKTFEHFRSADRGFRSAGVLTAGVAPPAQRYTTPVREAAFAKSVVEQLAALPGVDGAAASSVLPEAADARWAFLILDDPTSDYDHAPTARFVFVSPGYFHTMGIALKSGRALRSSDDRSATKVALIDERFARQNFPGRSPVGARLRATNGPDLDTVVVVGVVASVKQGGLVPEDVPWVYLPLDQAPFVGVFNDVVIHTTGNPVMLAAAVRGTISGLDSSVPVFDVATMDNAVDQSVSITRFSTFLASLFAITALGLGMIGVYSVLTFIVSRRKREVAIQLALGASRASVMGEVIRRALLLTSIGLAIGAGAAWWLTRALSGLFAGVDPHDPMVFLGAAGVFAVVALAAAAIPAIRTTKVNLIALLSAN